MDLDNVCPVCSSPSRYRCPKCRSPYCSVECYSQHDSQCTESFFKEQCMSLPKRTATAEFRQALQSNAEEREEDEQAADWDDNLLCLEELAISGKLTEQHLTDELREEFRQYVQDASNGMVKVELWKPWWISEYGTDPLQILEDFQQWDKLPVARVGIVDMEEAWQTSNHFPSIEKLHRGEISPSLPAHVCDGLLSIAFCLRRYDGDLLSDWPASLKDFFALSTILTSSSKHSFNVDQIVSMFLERSVKLDRLLVCLIAIYDVVWIINTRSFERAFIELMQLLSDASHFISGTDRAEIKRVHRKALFFAAVAKDLSDSQWECINKSLRKIWIQKCKDHQENIKINDECHWTSTKAESLLKLR